MFLASTTGDVPGRSQRSGRDRGAPEGAAGFRARRQGPGRHPCGQRLVSRQIPAAGAGGAPAPGRGGGQGAARGADDRRGDKNGDQKLSTATSSARSPTRWFDKIDTDKAGKVAQADFATRFAAALPPCGRRRRRHGQRAGGPREPTRRSGRSSTR